MESEVSRAAAILREARTIVVLTGAGMSAESGVPTFRDRDGHWSKFNPAELATPGAFARDPLKVWEWYRLRRAALRAVEPHDGHRVLADWARDSRFQLDIVTQNVDGLHHRAGSTRVIELHGRLDVSRCVGCEFRRQDLDDLGADPRCPRCAGRLRPGVVWFGESLPEGAFDAAAACVKDAAALLVIGTSSVVYPAASLAEIAVSRGRPVIEINPAETALSGSVTVRIRQSCRDALLALWRDVRGEAA